MNVYRGNAVFVAIMLARKQPEILWVGYVK
jgi:hypothetical protein